MSSRITEVESFKVFVPFKRKVHWSAGTRSGTTRLVVRVTTEDGIVGLGETICLWEFVEPVLRHTIAPLVIGEDAFDVERLVRKTEGAGYYHHKRALVAARAGLEMALWDVIGKKAGLPLYKLWGGRYRPEVVMDAYLQESDPDQLALEAAECVRRGFGTVKVKIGMGEESDILLVRVVREAVGPRVRVRADVNGAWTLATAKRQLRRLEPYDLEYVEQPLPLEDLAGHAHLRRLTSVPIALDESAFTLADVARIVAAEAADVIVIDPFKAGGLLEARKAAAVAEAAGLPITFHSGGELGIATAACTHLATVIPNLLFAIDSQYPNQADDIITTPFDVSEGRLAAPQGPGLGVSLDAAKVEQYTTDRIDGAYLDPGRPGWFPTKPMY